MVSREKKRSHGLSDQVRAMARAKYVQPAFRAGRTHFSIPVRALMEDLRVEGFPSNHYPQICSALQTTKFLMENGLEIEGVDGPPSKMSQTVVVRYRVEDAKANRARSGTGTTDERDDDPQARAKRLTDKLRGLLKEELAEYGGGEAFLRWIRSEDGNAA